MNNVLILKKSEANNNWGSKFLCVSEKYKLDNVFDAAMTSI